MQCKYLCFQMVLGDPYEGDLCTEGGFLPDPRLDTTPKHLVLQRDPLLNGKEKLKLQLSDLGRKQQQMPCRCHF